jgi:hypothetical protein
VDFHGEQRRNETHQSTTDADARLARKGQGKESKLSYPAHVLMENRHGLAVNGCVTKATGRAEAQAALAMVEEIPGWYRVTLGADKGYDRQELVQEMREQRVIPHFARKQTSIIDQRTTRHPGYQISQRKRKRVEEIFGWVKTIGGCVRPAIAGSRESIGCSASRWPFTTWSECATWRAHQHDCSEQERLAASVTVRSRIRDRFRPSYCLDSQLKKSNGTREVTPKSQFFRILLEVGLPSFTALCGADIWRLSSFAWRLNKRPLQITIADTAIL